MKSVGPSCLLKIKEKVRTDFLLLSFSLQHVGGQKQIFDSVAMGENCLLTCTTSVWFLRLGGPFGFACIFSKPGQKQRSGNLLGDVWGSGQHPSRPLKRSWVRLLLASLLDREAVCRGQQSLPHLCYMLCACEILFCCCLEDIWKGRKEVPRSFSGWHLVLPTEVTMEGKSKFSR